MILYYFLVKNNVGNLLLPYKKLFRRADFCSEGEKNGPKRSDRLPKCPDSLCDPSGLPFTGSGKFVPLA